MDDPGHPHIRIFQGELYLERAPGYWLHVCSKKTYDSCDDSAREFLISKALKIGEDFQWPPTLLV